VAARNETKIQYKRNCLFFQNPDKEKAFFENHRDKTELG